MAGCSDSRYIADEDHAVVTVVTVADQVGYTLIKYESALWGLRDSSSLNSFHAVRSASRNVVYRAGRLNPSSFHGQNMLFTMSSGGNVALSGIGGSL